MMLFWSEGSERVTAKEMRTQERWLVIAPAMTDDRQPKQNCSSDPSTALDRRRARALSRFSLSLSQGDFVSLRLAFDNQDKALNQSTLQLQTEGED